MSKWMWIYRLYEESVFYSEIQKVTNDFRLYPRHSGSFWLDYVQRWPDLCLDELEHSRRIVGRRLDDNGSRTVNHWRHLLLELPTRRKDMSSILELADCRMSLLQSRGASPNSDIRLILL